MTSPRFELASQHQKVSRLPTESSGRQACESGRNKESGKAKFESTDNLRGIV